MLAMTNVSLQLLLQALGKTNSPFPFCCINEARDGKKSPPSYLLIPLPCQFIFSRFIQRRDEKRPHAAVSAPVPHWGLCSHRDNSPASHPRSG